MGKIVNSLKSGGPAGSIDFCLMACVWRYSGRNSCGFSGDDENQAFKLIGIMLSVYLKIHKYQQNLRLVISKGWAEDFLSKTMPKPPGGPGGPTHPSSIHFKKTTRVADEIDYKIMLILNRRTKIDRNSPMRTIIWYKRACIRQTTRRLFVAIPTPKKDVNKSVVIEQVPN